MTKMTKTYISTITALSLTIMQPLFSFDFFSFSEHLETASQSTTSPFLLFGFALLMGVLVSFTPCIYPMIPITISIMHGNHASTIFKNFLRAITYVAGIATVYATLGYLAATTSLIFGQWTANPWIVLAIIAGLLYLSCSLFGFYDVYTPRFLRNNNTLSPNGSYLNIFLFGMLSGTVASPCLTPGLATLLSIAAKNGNPLIGFLMLFFFALGMGSLLVVIGTFSGAMSLLPRSGNWLEESKRVMGFLLLGMMVYFAEPFLNPTMTWLGYGLIVFTAIGYIVWRMYQHKTK